MKRQASRRAIIAWSGFPACFLLAFSLSAAAEKDSVPQVSRPIFEATGRLVYLQNSPSGLELVSMAPENPEDRAITSLSSGPGLSRPEIRLSRSGRIWLTAEDWETGAGVPIAGEVMGPLSHIAPSSGNRGADVCFDAYDRPWFAWRTAAGSVEALFVREGGTSVIRRLSGLADTALSTPRILADPAGIIWVVWSGKDRSGYGVFARRFDGGSWSRVERLAATGPFPCLQPDAAADAAGRIWVAWSAYDGSDYEIYYAHSTGLGWTKPLPLTADESSSAEFPSLALFQSLHPVISWTRTDATGFTLMAALLDGLRPAEPLVLGRATDIRPIVKTAAEGGRLAALWIEAGRVEIRVFEASDLYQPRRTAPWQPKILPRPAAQAAPAIIFNPALSEKGYICFGDSITYGHLAGENDPTKGYIPRLAAMIDKAFGSSDVYNDGFPGELTSTGLARIDALLAGRKARYILIMEGTNDVKDILIPIDAVIFNLKEMLRKSLAAGAFPAIATVIPRRDWIWFYPEYRDRQFALVAGIRQMAADYKIPLLDLFQDFNNYPNGPDALLDADGKHPNEIGYKFMAERWFDALGKFPFPPIGIQVAKKYDKILFYSLAGNMLSWQASPKIAAPAMIQGLKIYRRKPGEGPDKFQLLTLVKDAASFFDTEIQGKELYEYVIAALRTDGVEGPCSELVKSR